MRKRDDDDAEQPTGDGGEHLAHGHRGLLVAEQRRRTEQNRAGHACDDDPRIREVVARDEGEQQDRGRTDVDRRGRAGGDEPLVVG